MCISPPFGGDAKGRGEQDEKTNYFFIGITSLSVLLLVSVISYGQLQINWQQSYGSMASDWGYDIVQTNDGYLVTGIAGSGGGQVECFEDGGGWLLKINDQATLFGRGVLITLMLNVSLKLLIVRIII